MATLIQEQIEQKKKLLEEKAKEMKVIYDELVEAGAIDLSDDELDAVAGGRMGWGKIADVAGGCGYSHDPFRTPLPSDNSNS